MIMVACRFGGIFRQWSGCWRGLRFNA